MSNWDTLKYRSSPNEIGDMLAGFAGALAFIWIVVTVLLQAAELRDQRMQFEEMAIAQKAQAVLLEKQGEIFETEQEERRMASLARLTEELVANLRWKIETSYIQWVGEDDVYGNVGVVSIWNFSRDERDRLSDEIFFKEALDALQKITSEIDKFERRTPFQVLPKLAKLQLIYHETRVVLRHINELTLTDKTRFSRLQLLKLKDQMGALLRNDAIWEKEGEP